MRNSQEKFLTTCLSCYATQVDYIATMYCTFCSLSIPSSHKNTFKWKLKEVKLLKKYFYLAFVLKKWDDKNLLVCKTKELK